MLPIRIKACSESDLRMLGDLARNIQRVLPVTQADIDAAAALGKGWVVWKVVEVNDPIDNLRGGTQLVIKQNSITPGQNVRRVLIVSGPGGQVVVIGPAVSPLALDDAIADTMEYVKAFGGIEQNGTPTPGAPVDIVSNNGVLEFQDSELPSEYRRVLGYACDNDVLWQITGFHLRGSDTVRISFSVTAACNVFGCYQGTDATDNYDLYVSATSGNKYLRYGDGTYLSYWSSANMGQRFDVVFTPTGTSGMPQDSTWSPMTFESANDLLLAATTLTGTSSKLRGNLYGSFVVDGRLKLIPCERVSDSVLGYYDTYTGTFYEPTGTPTSLGYDFSYYSIKTSGTVETIGIHGKNWWNPDVDSYEAFYVTDGTQYERYGHIYRNGTYTISRSSSAGNWIIYAKLVSNGVYGAALNVTPDQTRTLTATGNDQILVYASSSSPTDTTVYEVQVEQGSTATEYAAYYNGGTATAEMLLKLFNKNGDTIYAQDAQNVTTGEITRNVGVKVFVGTETWTMGTNQDASNNRVFYTTIEDREIQDTNMGLLCTHFNFKGTIGYSTLTTGEFCINQSIKSVYFDGNGITTVDGWKQWLANQATAGTPLIVIYPLAEPTTQSVAGQTLQVQAGDNVLEITQASLSGLELEAEYTKVA